MNNQEKNGLKPCPFCGGVMRIESNRDWHKLMGDHDDRCLYEPFQVVSQYPANDTNLAYMTVEWNRRQPTTQPSAADERVGLLANAYETAAKWVEKRCDDYVSEHGSSDPETGMVEFPGDGEEYVGELMEIAEGLRALKQVEGGGDECRHGYATIFECPECGEPYQ